jgi:hypothetical protein
MNTTIATARPAARPGDRANPLPWAAQIRNLAATITRRSQPLAHPQTFHQNDQDRRPS